MDPLEKKIHELYQQKKREDEKSIPGFDAFRDNLEKLKPVKHSWFFLKVAASVVLVVAVGSYYFFSSRKLANETVKNYPLNMNQTLPSQSLLDKSLSTEYIWNWKSPTDQLLEDATKSLITEL